MTLPHGSTPVRVLLVEDNPRDAHSLLLMLAGGESPRHLVKHVSRVAEALALEEAETFDVVMLDLMLPDVKGLDGLERLTKKRPETPVIIMTHFDDEPTALAAIHEGAQDYLDKGQASRSLLVRSIRHAMERHRVHLELERRTRELSAANAALERLVMLDPLTELLNRRGLQQILSREIHAGRREGAEILVALIDLDDFKRVNDTLGHAVGDIVLKETAARLKASLRSTDSLARIGGDEFMVLLPQTRRAEAARVAEKLRLALSSSSLTVNSTPVALTASIGVVPATHATPSIDELLSQTHYVLQRSKRAGKNRVSCDWSGPAAHPGDESHPLSTILGDLRRGERLRAVMQPIYNLDDEREVGYEMLTRLSTGSFEMPGDFFRLCQEANMLTLVDHRCFTTCVEAASSLPANVRRHINLFPSTLIDIPVSHLLEAMPAGRERKSYCIEISEQQIIGDPSYLAAPVAAFKDAGVEVAIDDVGFGRSCLESMVMLEPDVVKIDRTCVNGISKDGSRARSLKRLLKVAHSLGSEVVAEGIEFRDDLEMLRQFGVKSGQGYLWGAPA